jgi:hypothetical protein
MMLEIKRPTPFLYRKTCGIKMALRYNLGIKIPQISFEIMGVREF